MGARLVLPAALGDGGVPWRFVGDPHANFAVTRRVMQENDAVAPLQGNNVASPHCQTVEILEIGQRNFRNDQPRELALRGIHPPRH